MNYAPFFERIGHLGICVLPARVLDSTRLVDPETGKVLPSLRQQCSSQGLCFAHVLYECAEGLYWADVAATPDLRDAERVVLTETHLTYALAWDERLRWRTPIQIRLLMHLQARDLTPLQPHPESVPAVDILPAPLVDQRADQDEAVQLYLVEIAAHDVREMVQPGDHIIQSADEPPTRGSPLLTHIKPVDPCVFQQVLLRIIRKALKRQLAQPRKPAVATVLKARCALVARVQDWHRRSRQRVVHVEGCRWSAVRKCWVWDLTLSVPESLLTAA